MKAPDTPLAPTLLGQAIDVRVRQAVLRERYRNDPGSAWVVDHAAIVSTDLHDPLRGRVRVGSSATADFDFEVHRAIGGNQEAPVPGDLLCAALASCQESSLRMVANVYGVALCALSVDVRAEVDVRGTLGMKAGVPVAFQALHVDVRLRAGAGTSAQRLQKMCRSAERACVVLQTLRAGVPVSLRIDTAIDGEPAPTSA
jgi:organic hydroperoxide reductase OsmC/OhrA